MSDHPINLALRFLLEIAASLAIGYWGWHQASGALRYLPAVALPLAAAVLWGTFRVPDDASASGDTPVPVPGPVRLLLEIALFGFGVWGLFRADATKLALVLAGAVVLHCLLSHDRVLWLLSQ